jgi:hypothetical protein
VKKREGVAALFVVALFGCQDGTDIATAKRAPKPPPPEHPAIPAELAIAVEVDGAPRDAIGKAKLEATKPDFEDDERRVWKLTTLLGGVAAREGVVLAVSGREGPEVLLRVPTSDGEPQPAILVSRRGEVVATMVSPQAPFPEYHGRGGRLGRSGDPVPRIVGVRKIRVYLER